MAPTLTFSLLVAALSLVACSGDRTRTAAVRQTLSQTVRPSAQTESPSPSPSPIPPIPHPTNPGGLILQVYVDGYLGTYPPGSLTHDALLLYGDGRLFSPTLARDVPGAQWLEVDLTEAGLQRLLRAAIEDGRLLDQPGGNYASLVECADCGVWHFSVHAADRYVSFDAENVHLSTNDFGRRLLAFIQLLPKLDASWFPANEVRRSGQYRPDAIWVQSFPLSEELKTGAALAWPASLPSLETLEKGGP